MARFEKENMSNLLLVPMRLDALVLGSERQMVQARVNFTLLPHSDGKRDANPDIAFISEEIVSQPFQYRNLTLKEGIHLHWALPDALANGRQTSSGTEFPTVPNRWLIIRSRKNSTDSRTVEQQWIVESDYLYPDGAGALSGSVNIPHAANELRNESRPFRFLGRKLPLEAWKGDDPQAEYWDQLTAVGYGEPTFAAFYPNCLSVFGFYDEDYSDNLPGGLQYDVLGWYGDPGKDHLKKFIAECRRGFKPSDDHPSLTARDYADAAKDSLKWVVTLGEAQEFPDQLLCYARLTFAPSGNSIENPVFANPNTSITVANTGAEALSAYLAETIDSANKTTIEDQLESLQLTSLLENRQLDVGPKFQEARHEKGFTAIDGGELWTIKLESRPSPGTNGNFDSGQAEITLLDAMAHQLNRLNLLQRAYDSGLEEIESRRKQLFSDWYKYMICAYPPEDTRDDYPHIDEVKYFIYAKQLLPLEKKIAAIGVLEYPADQADKNVPDSVSGSPPGSVAAQLADAIKRLASTIRDFNDTARSATQQATYALKRTASPRYYRPTDPVVLITGPAVNPTIRHGQDGLLPCQVMPGASAESLIPGDIPRIIAQIDQIAAASGQDSLAFNTWKVQPWNPFLLEWEAEVFPTEGQGNLHESRRDYVADFITSNYTVLENDVDLSLRQGKGAITAAANVYTGHSILTSYASDHLKGQIESFLQKQVFAAYCEAQKVPADSQTADYFLKHLAEVLAWYKQQRCGAQPADPNCNIIRAYELITAQGFFSLSQSLSGFNDSLLMLKQTMQLPVDDPLGFVEYQAFAKQVRDAVKNSTRVAPMPLNDFNPIRSGALKVTRLRLVDTFGQVLDLDCSRVNTTARQTIPSNPYLLALPPRIVQPSRLNFRWLSAALGEQESNDHPAATPICGWALANNLDGSLMIYDDSGKALGLINEFARWEPAPGDDHPVSKENIPNHFLRKLVNHVCSLGADFLRDFIVTIENALDNIEPENYAQHTDLALLMGRPLAIVRASLNLELQGLPAVNQSWDSFRLDLHRNARDDDRFDEVLFPIRIGEYRQFNDGVVGYWVEQDGGFKDNVFYAPQSDSIEDDRIKTHADDPMTIYQTVESDPQTLMMLIDPRGTVHATCGVAPTKSISLPPDQYAEALRNIEITFLSTPILTDLGKINLPLPAEAGYQWSWLQKDKNAWSEVSTTGVVKKQVFIDSFTNGQEVWDLLSKKGWIKQIDPTRASVAPKDQRPDKSLGDGMAGQVVAIENILASSYIGNVSLNAVFSSRQELREGWLKLSPASKKVSIEK